MVARSAAPRPRVAPLLGVGLGALLAAAPAPADACSVAGCLDNVLPAHGATIPANARGFFVDTEWWVTPGAPTALEAALFDPETGATLPSRQAVLAPRGVHAVSLLTDGSRSRVGLRYAQTCSWSTATSSATVTFGPPAPWPDTLGAVALGEVRQIEWMQPTFRQADCGPFVVSTVAAVTARLALSEQARPWRDAMRFRLEVDGVLQDEARAHPRYPMESFAARYGPEHAFGLRVPCHRTPAVRRVAIVADAPGFEAVVRTPTVEVRLTCEDAGDAGLEDSGPSAPTEPDAGRAAEGPLDAGAGGCRCVDPARAPWPARAALLALAAVLLLAGPRARKSALLIALLALAGCTDWREKVQPGVANPEPEQVMLEEAAPFPLPSRPSVTVTPRARYRNEAWAVAIDDDPGDDWAEEVALDVALAWGPVASPGILSHMTFHLKRRYVSVRWDGGMPLNQRVVMQHLSNHHLVAGSPAVQESLDQIRPGDFVKLEGKLVDLQGPAGQFRTSLSRDDVGNGACEVVWVERIEVARPR